MSLYAPVTKIRILITRPGVCDSRIGRRDSSETVPVSYYGQLRQRASSVFCSEQVLICVFRLISSRVNYAVLCVNQGFPLIAHALCIQDISFLKVCEPGTLPGLDVSVGQVSFADQFLVVHVRAHSFACPVVGPFICVFTVLLFVLPPQDGVTASPFRQTSHR
jgi:hypothetical protein